MSSTYQECRYEVYTILPWLCELTGTTDSIATGSITDAKLLENTGWDPSRFHSRTIFLSSLAAADRERDAGDLTKASGLLAQRGLAYVTATGLYTYEIVGKITPTVMFNLYVAAMKNRLKAKVDHKLGRVDDWDSEAANTTSWATSPGGATRAKTQTASKVNEGSQALEVTNSDAHGAVQSTSVAVEPGKWCFASDSALPSVGTAESILWDVTNGVALSTIVSAYKFYVVAQHRLTIPSNCYQVALRRGGVEASAVVAFDSVGGPWQEKDLLINAPSWEDATSKLRKVRKATYQPVGTTIGLFSASSRVIEDYSMPRKAELLVNYGAANPFRLMLTDSPPQDDLYLESLRPAYDLTKLSGAFVSPSNDATGESTTTDLDKRFVAAGWAMEICEYILAATKNQDGDAQAGLIKAKAIYEGFQVAEPVESAWRGRQNYHSFEAI